MNIFSRNFRIQSGQESPEINSSDKTQRCPVYSRFMKHNQAHPAPKQTQRADHRTSSTLSGREIAFTPTPDEVVRPAYFSNADQGSLPGHKVPASLNSAVEACGNKKPDTAKPCPVDGVSKRNYFLARAATMAGSKASPRRSVPMMLPSGPTRTVKGMDCTPYLPASLFCQPRPSKY